ncbi:hypothetical protein PSTG_14005 [Puccinia striiformis f. sp. tritici PST-78]|uniref:Myb/SANT-like domain-containing protein n=1 Tax=Puccinia striiformis f. sp. tritici PST-78 TaxID=1165861 RepID=A0A0L0V068_9BASI|nr:hypothetical protein PSTG_14005 [Puccinia striiformis f. sp. tritici PST-78]
MKEKPASSVSQTPTRIRPTKNTPKVSKIKTPTKKRTTTKKEKIRKEESEEEDVDQEASESDSKDHKKKKKKTHNWTEDQRITLLSLILDQVDLGKGTDNGNLKSKGWTAVRKEMFNQFKIAFEDHQLKNQKGDIRKLFIDMKFLLGLSGFGWNDTTQMVTADGDTWDELIEQHPKRLFSKLRRSTVPWYNLAEELFLDGTYATGATALNDPDKPNNTSSELLGLSKNSVKRRKIAAKAIDLDSSDDDKVEVVKKPAREPPKKRVRENKYDVLKSGVDSIVEALRGDKGQSDIKPNIKPPVATEPNPAPASNPRQEAIKLIASMFFGVVSITEYISFIRVVETEADAEVFISLASTTDSTVCKAWFLMATNPHLFFFLVKFNRVIY